MKSPARSNLSARSSETARSSLSPSDVLNESTEDVEPSSARETDAEPSPVDPSDSTHLLAEEESGRLAGAPSAVEEPGPSRAPQSWTDSDCSEFSAQSTLDSPEQHALRAMSLPHKPSAFAKQSTEKKKMGNHMGGFISGREESDLTRRVRRGVELPRPMDGEEDEQSVASMSSKVSRPESGKARRSRAGDGPDSALCMDDKVASMSGFPRFLRPESGKIGKSRGGDDSDGQIKAQTRFSLPRSQFSSKSAKTSLLSGYTKDDGEFPAGLARGPVSSDLFDVASRLEEAVSMGTNRWKGKTYRKCCTGKDLCRALVESYTVFELAEAFPLGDALIQAGILVPVDGVVKLRDNSEPFRFASQWKSTVQVSHTSPDPAPLV